jgi:hypothetical protein
MVDRSRPRRILWAAAPATPAAPLEVNRFPPPSPQHRVDRPATFATTPAIAAPNAVPIERTEAKAEAVLRCSSEATLSIARATRCTLYAPMPIPITKALSVMSASPGSKATAVRQASICRKYPIPLTPLKKRSKRRRFPCSVASDANRLPRSASSVAIAVSAPAMSGKGPGQLHRSPACAR